MSMPQGQLTVTEIAALAGVTSGAVSNWRRRYKGQEAFPPPVAGTATKPLFDRAEVIEWLTARGLRIKSSAAEIIWSVFNMLRGQLPVDRMVDNVLRLLTARKTGTPEHVDWPEAPRYLADDVESAIAQIPLADMADVADDLLERYARSQARVGGEHGFVGSRTSSLLASLAASRPDAKVLYDPACGMGVALLQAVADGARPSRVIGHDLNTQICEWARMRAALHGVPLELRRGDVLHRDPDPELRADTIIAEPPFGLYWDPSGSLADPRFTYGVPPKSSADLAWIQHVIAHLTDTGRGYVLTPTLTLARGRREEGIRVELLRQGCVEAIVNLPGKMLPHTAIPLALWVVCRPGQSQFPGDVLLIDASAEDDVETKVAAWLTQPDPAVPHTKVPAEEIIAANANLTASAWIQTRTDDVVTRADYQHGWKALQQGLQGLPASIPPVEQLGQGRVISVKSLIEQEVLGLATGRQTPDDDSRVVTAADIRDGSLAATQDQGTDTDDSATQPGDVLVTTMHQVRARVDEAGGHLPGNGVFRLRVLRPDVLDPGYLAVALTGPWNKRFQSGMTIQRAPIRDIEIPLLPLADQHKIQDTLAALTRTREQLAAVSGQIETAKNLLLDVAYYNVPLTGARDQ